MTTAIRTPPAAAATLEVHLDKEQSCSPPAHSLVWRDTVHLGPLAIGIQHVLRSRAHIGADIGSVASGDLVDAVEERMRDHSAPLGKDAPRLSYAGMNRTAVAAEIENQGSIRHGHQVKLRKVLDDGGHEV